MLLSYKLALNALDTGSVDDALKVIERKSIINDLAQEATSYLATRLVDLEPGRVDKFQMESEMVSATGISIPFRGASQGSALNFTLTMRIRMTSLNSSGNTLMLPVLRNTATCMVLWRTAVTLLAAASLWVTFATPAQAQWNNRYSKLSDFGHHTYLEQHELPILAAGPTDPAPSPDGRPPPAFAATGLAVAAGS